MSSSVVKQSDVLKTGCLGSAVWKEERKEKQCRKEESKLRQQDPQPNSSINSDLSLWPSLWLSSWPRVAKADPRHRRRIVGMAQLLWGWLEFPVSFLTDAVRKVQGCSNSSWGRTSPEQSQGGRAVIEEELGGVPSPLVLSTVSHLEFSGEKHQKDHWYTAWWMFIKRRTCRGVQLQLCPNS